MADITMCKDKECKLISMCYRFKANPSEHRQSYFGKSPRKKNKCDMFWGEANQQLAERIRDLYQ